MDDAPALGGSGVEGLRRACVLAMRLDLELGGDTGSLQPQ